MKLNLKESVKQSKGITLIALVITIIVLLILAGVTIATLTGENGILTQANKAKTETTEAEEKEAIALAYNGAMLETNGESVTAEGLNNQFSKNGTKATASGEGTIEVDFETGRSYIVDAYGKIEEWIDIKVGDLVDYRPTVIDKSGTPVDAEETTEENKKLVYISQTGSATEHGNGYTSSEEGGGQKFTATAKKTRWRVLSIENGTVELISEDVIKTDTNENFILKGAIGYLYAEQELNEICKIFGYGYGADTSQVTKYRYGGPVDGELTGEITDSGARKYNNRRYQ